MAKVKAGSGVMVTGDKEVDALLASLPLRVQKSVFRKALRPAAKSIVLPAAQNNVPEDTGELRDSLQVKALQSNIVKQRRTTGRFAGTMGRVNLNRNRVGVQVQTRDAFFKGDQFYGGFTEFGTKVRRHKSGKNVGAVVEVAWLRRAVYDNEAAVTSKVMSVLRTELASVRKRP